MAAGRDLRREGDMTPEPSRSRAISSPGLIDGRRSDRLRAAAARTARTVLTPLRLPFQRPAVRQRAAVLRHLPGQPVRPVRAGDDGQQPGRDVSVPGLGRGD